MPSLESASFAVVFCPAAIVSFMLSGFSFAIGVATPLPVRDTLRALLALLAMVQVAE